MLVFITLIGCNTSTFKNVNIDPPTRGLLAALQQEQMVSETDKGYRVEVLSRDGRSIQTGKNDLILQVVNLDGKPVQKFREDMTKLMHLIIVSEDLSSFEHVHPAYMGKGEFEIQVNLPFSGRFQFISEFKPNNDEITIYKKWLAVEGEVHTAELINPSSLFKIELDELSISLSASPAITEIKAGQMVMLLFRINDVKTGKPVKKLEPFLGTTGHCVIMDSTAEKFIHAHAAEEMSSGGNVMFHTVFPEKGTYKLWGQFQYLGETITAPFVVTVS